MLSQQLQKCNRKNAWPSIVLKIVQKLDVKDTLSLPCRTAPPLIYCSVTKCQVEIFQYLTINHEENIYRYVTKSQVKILQFILLLTFITKAHILSSFELDVAMRMTLMEISVWCKNLHVVLRSRDMT